MTRTIDGGPPTLRAPCAEPHARRSACAPTAPASSCAALRPCDGWVLAAGQHGLRWIKTRPQLLRPVPRGGAMPAIGIAAQDTAHVVDGISLPKGVKSDRPGAGQPLRCRPCDPHPRDRDRAGCWPTDCWIDPPNAGPISIRGDAELAVTSNTPGGPDHRPTPAHRPRRSHDGCLCLFVVGWS